jgi:ribonuclease P protein component
VRKLYPKSHRLLKRRQFQKVSARAQRLQGSWLYVEVSGNPLDRTRLGITVTRKYGNACCRNRFKRVVREVFRSCYQQLPQGIDLIVRPRRGILNAKFLELQEDFLSLFAVLQS